MHYLLIVLLLSGCAKMHAKRADAVIAREGVFCERLGYVKGSDEWKQCVMSQNSKRQVCNQVGTTLVCQ